MCFPFYLTILNRKWLMSFILAVFCVLLSFLWAPCLSRLIAYVLEYLDQIINWDKFLPTVPEDGKSPDERLYTEVGWVGVFLSLVISLVALFVFDSPKWAMISAISGGAILWAVVLAIFLAFMLFYNLWKYLREFYRVPWNNLVGFLGKDGWKIDLARAAQEEALHQSVLDTTEKMERINDRTVSS